MSKNDYDYLPTDEREAVDRCMSKAVKLPRSEIASEDLSGTRRVSAQNTGDAVEYVIHRPGEKNAWSK